MKKTKFNVNFTKKLFVETINKIEEQKRHDDKCAGAFKTLLPNDHVTSYDNYKLYDQLIKILKIAMNDELDWIDYFIYDLDFGSKYYDGCVKLRGNNFTLKTPSDLYILFKES